jgi:hypothetical protein
MHMSWSASVSSVAARDAASKLRENFAATYTAPTPEVVEQFEAAVRGLEGALTVVQPDLDGLVNVAASGHANPGHLKTPGWSNDTFTLTVYQV